MFFDRVSEVVADPAINAIPATVDKPVHLLERAVERKGFFDDKRLSDIVHCECRECSVDLIPSRIRVNADEVEVLRDLG